MRRSWLPKKSAPPSRVPYQRGRASLFRGRQKRNRPAFLLVKLPEPRPWAINCEGAPGRLCRALANRSFLGLGYTWRLHRRVSYRAADSIPPAGPATESGKSTGISVRPSRGNNVVRYTVCLSHVSRSSCFQLFRSCNYLTRPLCSSPVTEPPRSYGSVRPSAPHWYSRLAVLAAPASPFTSERLVPAVPCNRLHPSHTPSTPAATRPFIRHLARLSQIGTLLVSTTLDFLTPRPRKVHFRSFLGCTPAPVSSLFSSNAHHRRLLTAAAWRWFETCS
jgi:hypothetical protein